MTKLNAGDWVAIVLAVVGGLNWGIIGIFGYDVIGGIFGQMSILTRFLYILFGLSALYIAALSGNLIKAGGMAGVREAFAKDEGEE